VAQRAVYIKRRGRHVCSAIASVEANAAQGGSCRDLVVVTLVRQRHARALLGVICVPRFGDRLISRPGPGQSPGSYIYGAGVLNRDGAAEAVVPLAGDAVTYMACESAGGGGAGLIGGRGLPARIHRGDAE